MKPEPELTKADLSPVEELRQIAAGLRTHLEWLREGGVAGVPRPPRSVLPPPRPEPQGPATRPAAPLSSPPRPAPPPSGLPDPLPVLGEEGLRLTRDILGNCRRCKLCHGRTQIVFGQGSPQPLLVFVGEGPGAEEDRSGLAFVGAAGELLTQMIGAMAKKARELGAPAVAARLSRDEVYICNVVKCRPPGNRTPEADEMAACGPFLRAQLQALRPRLIVALGRTPAQYLLSTAAPIGKLRGHMAQWEGIPVMPTYHPAYLLRTPSAKRQAWEDLQAVVAELIRRS
ncbi:MAG: uracil-DNA glycosylase [Myxococcales bacterium]|nr:uracil-DNA glycosylase [Myxococcales bacterium]